MAESPKENIEYDIFDGRLIEVRCISFGAPLPHNPRHIKPLERFSADVEVVRQFWWNNINHVMCRHAPDAVIAFYAHRQFRPTMTLNIYGAADYVRWNIHPNICDAGSRYAELLPAQTHFIAPGEAKNWDDIQWCHEHTDWAGLTVCSWQEKGYPRSFIPQQAIPTGDPESPYTVRGTIVIPHKQKRMTGCFFGSDELTDRFERIWPASPM